MRWRGGNYLRHVGLPKIPDTIVFSINRIEKTSITSFRASRRLIRHDRPLRPSHGGRLASLHALRPPTPAVPLLSRFPTSRLCQTAEEPDHMGQLHNVRRTALADENEVQSYGVLKNYATIPISEIIDVGPGFTVMKYIEGGPGDRMESSAPQSVESHQIGVARIHSSILVGSEPISPVCHLFPAQYYSHTKP